MASEYKGRATLINIGRSSEGKSLKVLQVGSGERGKPAIFIDGGIHAREWISPSTVTYILKEFLENPAKYSKILSKVDLYFLPLANPDVYEFSLHKMGLVGARAIGRNYKVGLTAKVNYEAAGASDDWAKGSAGIKYSYTIELPDTGRYKFLLPASRIGSTVREAARAVKAMGEDLARNIR